MIRPLIALAALLLAGVPPVHAQYTDALATSIPAPPELPRELRGVWIATVDNMDWPSRPGLPVEQQKAELIRILDTARRLRLNAVIFQVRPMANALYKSELEPWSHFLTGVMGKAPEPFYDPLAFAIAEAHRRGLELHAWFNPFRAVQAGASKHVTSKHISRTRPGLTRKYGPYLWLDPGEEAVRAHSMRVIEDVVRRYDIDGVHIDDYFYPYQERDRRDRLIRFPDDKSWKRYRATGGDDSRDDWRRHNIDGFVRNLYARVKAIRADVKVGISPFGIWRPGNPVSVDGMDAYAEIFADARKWLREGWVDYFVPQLYWRTNAPRQPYVDLLRWWTDQNTHNRHIWAGNAPFRIAGTLNWSASEILEQIRLTRDQPRASGNVHFSMRSLMQNRGGFTDSLATASYAYDALVPASPWIDSVAPPAPLLRITEHPLFRALLTIEPTAGEQPFKWAVRTRYGNTWYAEVIPAIQHSYLLLRGVPAVLPDELAVSAVDRTGNESVMVRVSVGDATFSGGIGQRGR